VLATRTLRIHNSLLLLTYTRCSSDCCFLVLARGEGRSGRGGEGWAYRQSPDFILWPKH